MILDYVRNKHTSTIDLEDSSILARSTVEDILFAATVEMVIKLPDLEIASASGAIKRSFSEECREAIPLLEKVEGLRVGPGIIKAVERLVGGSDGCPRMADLILECCNGVILRFTADPLREILSKGGQKQIAAYKEFVKRNPRLIGGCIAFVEGSPLREGLEV